MGVWMPCNILILLSFSFRLVILGAAHQSRTARGVLHWCAAPCVIIRRGHEYSDTVLDTRKTILKTSERTYTLYWRSPRSHRRKENVRNIFYYKAIVAPAGSRTYLVLFEHTRASGQGQGPGGGGYLKRGRFSLWGGYECFMIHSYCLLGFVILCATRRSRTV